MPERYPELDGVEEHEHGRVRRVAWAVLTLIVAAALAGLLGPGPLSWTTASDPAGLVQVEYSRFTHHLADTTVELRVRPDPARPDVARVWISSEYLSGLNVRQVTPEPVAWTAAEGGSVLTFPMSGSAELVEVQIELRVDRLGLLRGAVGVPGRAPAEFWQFVHP